MSWEKSERRNLNAIRLSETRIVRESDSVATPPRAINRLSRSGN